MPESPMSSETNDQRASDYRSGYSTGYADAKAATPIRDEEAAALFLNRCPLWSVTVYGYDMDPSNKDDDGFFTRTEEVHALDEATAVERGEAKVRADIPLADIETERTTCERVASPEPEDR